MTLKLDQNIVFLFSGNGFPRPLEFRHYSDVAAIGRLFFRRSTVKAFDPHLKKKATKAKQKWKACICCDLQITQCRSVLAKTIAFAVLTHAKERVKALSELLQSPFKQDVHRSIGFHLSLARRFFYSVFI